MSASIPETWGRVYAIIDNAAPGQLPATAINNATQALGLHFAPHHTRAISRHEQAMGAIVERARDPGMLFASPRLVKQAHGDSC